MTSDDNNLNDFPENQLTKFRAVYTMSNGDQKMFVVKSFTQNSLVEKIAVANPWRVRKPPHPFPFK